MTTPETIARFYLDPMTALLAAIVRTEGGEYAFFREAKRYIPTIDTEEQAHAECCRILRSRLVAAQNFDIPVFTCVPLPGADPYTGQGGASTLAFTEQFIQFLAARWRPRSEDDGDDSWVRTVHQIHVRELQKKGGTA